MHQLRILVVEDEPLCRRVVKNCLEEQGCTVLEADSCRRAEALWSGDQVDAVVLDNRLPDSSGLDLLRHMRQRGHRERVVWLSADTNVLSGKGARELNLLAVLTKPLHLECLQAAIAQLQRERNAV